MLWKFFQSRLAVATAASVAVVALMTMSIGTVQAVVEQDQQENEEAKQSETELRRAKVREHRVLAESRLHVAREAIHAARERGAQQRLRLVQTMRDHVRAPRVELRRLRSSFGGSLADRVLAMGEEIELTEQQESQIRDGRRDQRRAEIERDAQIDVLDLDLEELLEDRHTANLDAVEELMQRRASLRVQGQVDDMRASQGVWSSLSTEQQEKLEANRHGVFMLRGNRPHALFFDREGPDVLFEGGDFEFGDLDFGGMEFGRLFNELNLEGLEGLLELQSGDGLFELKSDDGGRFIWRFGHSDDDDADEDGEKKEKATTEGTAIGV